MATSEYLKIIGSKLAPDIDIMWTGDKVIPKEITVASLEGITQVLKRLPVIWDNEHANDYDQKRVYLGKEYALSLWSAWEYRWIRNGSCRIIS